MRGRRKLRSRAKPSLARLISSVFPRYYLLLRTGDYLLLKKAGRLTLKARHVYDPYVALAGKLVRAFDWRRSDLITESGGYVSSITDVIGGSAAWTQGSGSLQPTWSLADGFSFDGLDDYMDMATSGLPTAVPHEFRGLFKQSSTTGTANRAAVCYGSNTNASQQIVLGRRVTSSVNRARAIVNGGELSETTVTLTGVHRLGMKAQSSLGSLLVNAANPVTVASTPVLGTGRCRIGAGGTTVPATFWHGAHYLGFWFNDVLTTDESAALDAYLADLAATL